MNFEKKLIAIANKYPEKMIEDHLLDIKRTNYHINLAINSCKNKNINELEICDLGGGLSPFSIGCASLEFKRSIVVDDFDDSNNHVVGNEPKNFLKEHGVEIFERDIIEKGIEDIEGNFDIITSFDSMEHWHNSPKKLFHHVMSKLKNDGTFILGVPNCANLRKRITLPMGFGKWSSMHSWYEEVKFRGHVREPDVSDLNYIAKDMGLKNIKIYGRNWLGYNNPSELVKKLTIIVAPILNNFPSLCSDIYLVGKKNKL